MAVDELQEVQHHGARKTLLVAVLPLWLSGFDENDENIHCMDYLQVPKRRRQAGKVKCACGRDWGSQLTMFSRTSC
eukprot:scaffold433_cov257-Pinguiococcus_pyrenoidosus.AAC.35